MSWTILTVLGTLAVLACVVFLIIRSKTGGGEKSKSGSTLLPPLSARPHTAQRRAAEPQPVERDRREAPARAAPPARAAEPAGDSGLKRLVNLVYDERRAQRLVEAVRVKHPGMPNDWCVERAIEQVLRDRHAR